MFCYLIKIFIIIRKKTYSEKKINNIKLHESVL